LGLAVKAVSDAESKMPPVAMAWLSAPKAIARSPVPEVAVAEPSWTNIIPSIEMATFGSGGETGSAAAVPAVAASAASMPSPSASPPSQPIPLPCLIGRPFSRPRRRWTRIIHSALPTE
jgi:hypothetical protein